jgi:hypothetical protein
MDMTISKDKKTKKPKRKRKYIFSNLKKDKGSIYDDPASHEIFGPPVPNPHKARAIAKRLEESMREHLKFLWSRNNE